MKSLAYINVFFSVLFIGNVYSATVFRDQVRCNELFLIHQSLDDALNKSGSRVSDEVYSGTVSIEEVLENLKQTLSVFPYVSDLSLFLSDNYLTASGFNKIVDFFIQPENEQIAKKISFINLENNRIDSTSKNDIKRLLEKFSNLRLDLSINYLTRLELTGFGNRIVISNY